VRLEAARELRVTAAVQSALSILQNHFREHNRSVLFASGATLLFAALGWAFIYGLFYWFTIAFLSVKDGLGFVHADNFNRNFFSSVAVLYAATLLDRWMFRFESDAVDRRPLSETVLDIVLFLPRMSLAVFENFGVWIRLSEPQMRSAARLVELIRERGRYSLQEVPVVIPDDRESMAVVTALRVAQVVDVRPADGVLWLYIGGLAPSGLAPRVPIVFPVEKIVRAKERPQFERKQPRSALPDRKS
jgi:hypothetical protein